MLSQLSTQKPWLHRWPSGQRTFTQSCSTHAPRMEHTSPTKHAPTTQRGTHWPSSQIVSPWHVDPSSTMPLQSLSTPSQASAVGSPACTQTDCDPRHW